MKESIEKIYSKWECEGWKVENKFLHKIFTSISYIWLPHLWFVHSIKQIHTHEGSKHFIRKSTFCVRGMSNLDILFSSCYRMYLLWGKSDMIITYIHKQSAGSLVNFPFNVKTKIGFFVSTMIVYLTEKIYTMFLNILADGR